MVEQIVFEKCKVNDGLVASPMLYASVHELMDFMFQDKKVAERVLSKLLKFKRGHFSHQFITVAKVEGEILGLELGYDRGEMSKQDLLGALYMLLSSPLIKWPHLILKTSSALNGYVLPPSAEAYYINNLAVSEESRGQGLGKKLLSYTIDKAKEAGYKFVDLDVTEPNKGAISFYEREGFVHISTSGTDELMSKYGLPKLLRMRYEL